MMSLTPTAMPRSGPEPAARTFSARQTKAPMVLSLLVEQDVFAAFSVADRAYVMETGRIVREGPVKALETDPELRRAYLGVA